MNKDKDMDIYKFNVMKITLAFKIILYQLNILKDFMSVKIDPTEIERILDERR
jgi:hypothetical protein